MRQLLIPLVAAALLFAALPSTALMATITVDNVCGGANGTVSVGFTYNDQTNAVQSLIVNNNSGGAVSIVGQIYDTNGTLLFSQLNSINANQPQIVVNVNQLNLTMVMVTGPHGTSLQFPGRIGCSITPGR